MAFSDVFIIKYLLYPIFTNFYISEEYFLKKLRLKGVGVRAYKGGGGAIEPEKFTTGSLKQQQQNKVPVNPEWNEWNKNFNRTQKRKYK